MKNFVTKLSKFDSNVYQYHLPVPEEIAQNFIEGENRRIICTLNGVHKWHAALMKAQDYWFILVNKAIMEKLGLTQNVDVKVELEKDHSTYGLEMPDELQVLFEQDEDAYSYFKNLTMGKQRSLIYIVGKYKSSDSRLRKALAIAHHLKEVQGNLDYKLLNSTIKFYNNKPL